MAGIAPDVAVSPEVAQLTESVIDLRRTLHQWPELGFQEKRTSALFAERLQSEEARNAVMAFLTRKKG